MRAEPKIPTLTPVEAPLTAEEKKVRQRLYVKRAYYRKLSDLQQIRDYVKHLEAVYDQLVSQKQSKDSTSPPDDSNSAAINQYTELLRVKHELRQQNEAMRDAVDEFHAFEHNLALWINSEDVAANSSGDENPQYTAGRSSIVIPKLQHPVAVDICREIARLTYEDMQVFRQSHGFLSTGLSVFGWRDKRLYEGDHIKFSVKKIFHGYSTSALAVRTWNIMSSAKTFPTLYPSSLNVKMFTLQEVDQDNVICFRVIPSPDGLTLVKSLFLISHYTTPDGYAVLLRSIDQSLLAPYQDPPGVREQWIDYYIWVTFDRVGDQGQHCRLDYGGEIKSMAVMDSNGWMLEVLLVALRWENKVIGPVFSLQPP